MSVKADPFLTSGLFSDDDADGPVDRDKSPTGFHSSISPETWDVHLNAERPQEELKVITFKSMIDIEGKPYSAEEFTLDEKVIFDEHGNRVVRAPALNRIRYRFNYKARDKGLAVESNSRIVRWSDGSASLFIGKECVDLKEEPLEGQSLMLGVKDAKDDIVMAQQLLKTRIVIRPPALDSKLHQNVAQAISPEKHPDRTIKATATLEDFGREHMEAAERDLEQRKIREKQNRRMKRKSSGSDLPRRLGNHRLSAAYLEEQEDDYDDEYERDTQRGSRLGTSSEAQAEKRLLQTKAGRYQASVLVDDDDDDNVILSDDDQDIIEHQKHYKHRKVALEDSDDDF